MKDYSAMAAEVENQIIEWYGWLHRNPELGFHEECTSRYIETVLGGFSGMDTVRPCTTGVMGILKGSRPGRTVAFRADIDGLPLDEKADVPYKSGNPGVMHACGHDGHVAMLLGAAKILSGMRGEIRGEIRFLFQPAEEVLPGGAVRMIEGGAIDGADLIFGAHLDVLHPVNSFGLHAGALMASATSFEIVIEGNGGHAAFPFQTVDTVYAAARIIEAIQAVVTRNISAMDRAVITVTQLRGSTASNIIPAEVRLGGTLRVLDEACEGKLRERLKEVVESCCSAWGAAGRIDFTDGVKAVINPPYLSEQVRQSIVRCTGASVYEDIPVLGGEDFSMYQQHVPGFYYKVGARPSQGDVYPHHNEHFHINPDALAKGAAACVSILMDAVQSG